MSSHGSDTSSVHSKHPYTEPKQVEALAAFRTLLGADNEKYDDGVGASLPLPTEPAWATRSFS